MIQLSRRYGLLLIGFLDMRNVYKLEHSERTLLWCSMLSRRWKPCPCSRCWSLGVLHSLMTQKSLQTPDMYRRRCASALLLQSPPDPLVVSMRGMQASLWDSHERWCERSACLLSDSYASQLDTCPLKSCTLRTSLHCSFQSALRADSWTSSSCRTLL